MIEELTGEMAPRDRAGEIVTLLYDYMESRFEKQYAEFFTPAELKASITMVLFDKLHQKYWKSH